jgi:hypothetical protein
MGLRGSAHGGTRRRGPLLVALCLATLTTPPALAARSSSASYVLQQSAVGGAGAPSDSPSYDLDGTAGQESAVGASSSVHYVVQSGFWSFVGSGLVPVLLTVLQNGVDPEHIDLSWSGNNAPYNVYQATDCTDVTASFFDQTASNFYLDIDPPVADLVCYLVLATAPGPERTLPRAP